MNAVIDTRVSPQMRERLLANRHGKLHTDQWREVVTEPVVTVMLLMVPAVILLRSFLLTLFVGGLWMIGVGALIVAGVMLIMRARRYARVPVYFGLFRAPEKIDSKWKFWKPIMLKTTDGTDLLLKHSLSPDKRFQAGQEYLLYYLMSSDGNTLLSFAPTDHIDSAVWWPSNNFKTRFTLK